MQILAQDGSRQQMVWNGYLRAGYSVWPLGRECELHAHRDAVELFIFLDGQCEITVGDEVQVVGPGQTAYVGPEAWHKLRVVGDRPLSMFWAVLPNHSPNHTFLDSAGEPYDTDTPDPAADNPRIIR